MISLDINTAGIRPAIEALDASDSQIERALRSTLGKLAAWAKGRATKAMARELQMDQRTIRRRLKTTRVRNTSGGASITVWFGLNPVGIIHLGARQTRRGVSARGGRRLDHAFIATMQSGKRGVFRRRGAARLKIDLQRENIEDQGRGYLIDDLAKSPEMEARFVGIFERELKWQMSRQR